jgi:DNA-binding CsgD family transcriptional regulator
MSSAHTWLRGDGMSIREVADALGISPMRVQQLERSAIKKLRRSGVLYLYARQLFEPDVTSAKEGAER